MLFGESIEHKNKHFRLVITVIVPHIWVFCHHVDVSEYDFEEISEVSGGEQDIGTHCIHIMKII